MRSPPSSRNGSSSKTSASGCARSRRRRARPRSRRSSVRESWHVQVESRRTSHAVARTTLARLDKQHGELDCSGATSLRAPAERRRGAAGCARGRARNARSTARMQVEAELHAARLASEELDALLRERESENAPRSMSASRRRAPHSTMRASRRSRCACGARASPNSSRPPRSSWPSAPRRPRGRSDGRSPGMPDFRRPRERSSAWDR